MLQQTRVRAAIPYFERFVGRFPSIDALAQAREEDVLAAWAGLGYYSRARNLMKAAREIVAAGGFPDEYASIRKLPGIGDYTAAAIASIAFGLPYAAMDGNVLRVMSRITAERRNIRMSSTRAALERAANELLDAQNPGVSNQAFMELGATVCLPQNPQCLLCPISSLCRARQLVIQNELPISSQKPSPVRIEKDLLIIKQGDRILFWQRPTNDKRLAGFWELPEKEMLPHARSEALLGTFQHTIVNTRFSVRAIAASVDNPSEAFEWLGPNELNAYPLTTMARKALRYVAC